jgi:hypothetical protein
MQTSMSEAICQQDDLVRAKRAGSGMPFSTTVSLLPVSLLTSGLRDIASRSLLTVKDAESQTSLILVVSCLKEELKLRL